MIHMRIATLALLAAMAAPAFADEGCTPGYWKNHPERWDGANGDDFTITVQHQANFNMFFGVTSAQSGFTNSATLHEAVAAGGGGLMALGRHAAAGAASADSIIDYPLTLNDVVLLYRMAVGADVESIDMEAAKNKLEAANEAGCPLGNQDPDITTYCFGDEGDCPCGPYIGGGCLNSAGMVALLTGSGTTSVAADDLVLTTTQLPVNAFAMTFMGFQGGSTTFGNGSLCVSAPGSKLFRYKPAQNSDAGGSISLGPGIVNYSQWFAVDGGNVLPGSTWYFQTYYRDTGGQCNSNFNFSNALRVDFTP